jgi:predicted RNase H-like HicB family nuclease
MSYYVYITRENNCFVGEVPTVPGCRTYGKTEGEVVENMRIILAGTLRAMKEQRKSLPEVKVVKVSDRSLAHAQGFQRR